MKMEFRYVIEQVCSLPPFGELGLFRLRISFNRKQQVRYLIGPYNKRLLENNLRTDEPV